MTTQVNQNIRLFPSLMAANPLYLADIIKDLEPYCQGFHLDVMDDHFVPNITFGTATLNAIGRMIKKPCWIHLMVMRPKPWLKRLTLPRNSIISFHPQSDVDSLAFIESIHKQGWIASITLSPDTSVDSIKRYVKRINHITVMGVEPGFSGQRFIQSTYKKLEELNRMLGAHKVTIGVDGGVTAANIATIYSYGVTDFVIGAALFNSNNPAATLKALNLKKDSL